MSTCILHIEGTANCSIYGSITRDASTDSCLINEITRGLPNISVRVRALIVHALIKISIDHELTHAKNPKTYI